MTKRSTWARRIGARGLVAMLVVVAADARAAGVVNLLSNSGFEAGAGGSPDGWSTLVIGSAGDVPVFTWDTAASSEGACSVKIESTSTRTGLWLQEVSALPSTVYTLTGQVKFEGVVAPGSCFLRVVFRDASRAIIEMIDLPAHDGTRPFELDFPYNLKFRSPATAASAEVNCVLSGVGAAWFDDLVFGVAPTGSIAGHVLSDGSPVEGARVWIWGDPWDGVYEAYTDGLGAYLIGDVPVAFPRYILLAERSGFRTRPTGEVVLVEGDVTEVDFELARGRDPVDDLRVKYGCLEQVDPVLPLSVPTDAVIPADPADYPASVQPFLIADDYITSDHPEIVSLAADILAGVDPADRSNTYAVAWAVYEHVVRHISHDAVFTPDTRDVTSGIWQTIQSGGWCWGRSFYDWGYKPHETLQVGCAICVEHSWLASSLLRALNIPARARVGSAQFWVQDPGTYGYWVGLSTNGGSNEYRKHGIMGVGFGNSAFPSFVPVISEPFLAEDWNAINPGLWHETHPWGENYPGTSAGLSQAHADLDTFETTGEAANGTGATPGSTRYGINYSDITVNLLNLGGQRILDTRFPIVTESDTHHDMERQGWWTNHPECVTRTWVEEIVNPPVEGVQRWYHIEFDVTSLLSLGDFDGDGAVDLADSAVFQTCYTGDGGGPVGSACEVGDFDGDGDVDCADWDGFVVAWTGPGDPPDLLACAGAPVPAMAGGGVAMTVVLLMGTGSVLLRRGS